MAKYAAKGEPRSQTVHWIFKTCVDSASCSSHAHKALRSALLDVLEKGTTAHKKLATCY